MLFVVDIGNTQTVMGVFQDDSLLRDWRVATDKSKTSDEYGVLIKNLLAAVDIQFFDFHAVTISSVVPLLTQTFEEFCRKYLHINPLIVGPGMKTGMPILMDNPKEVGADRIVNAVAAYRRFGQACIVVDFGTATTFDCISAAGEYLGGVISPGVGISLEALFKGTSKLPRVEIIRPRTVIGKNTVHSIQSGIFYGYVSMVDGMVARLQKRNGGTAGQCDRHRRVGGPYYTRIKDNRRGRPLSHSEGASSPVPDQHTGLIAVPAGFRWGVGSGRGVHDQGLQPH